MGEGGGKKKRIGWGGVREGQRKANGGVKQQRNVKRIVWEISRGMPKVGQTPPVREGGVYTVVYVSRHSPPKDCACGWTQIRQWTGHPRQSPCVK